MEICHPIFSEQVLVRKVTFEDAQEITDIYNYYVKNSVATLEEKTVSSYFFEDAIRFITKDFPWFVYAVDGKILGYAHAGKWKEKSGFRKTVELTIYLKPGVTQKGIGSLLYKEVIKEVKRTDINVLVSAISLPNQASVKLHEKFGFVKAAHFKEIGYKFNKWVDVGYWQLTLNN